MNNRGERLAKNTIIIALGNVGSKVLQVILVPFYTRVMSSEEFGTVDLLQAIVALLLPISVLSIFEAVFRMAMDKKYDKEKVLYNGLIISIIGSTVLCLVAIPFAMFLNKTYVWLVVINTIAVAFWTLFSRYVKAVGKTMLFAVNNIVLTAVILLLNILFLVVFHLGIFGYMLAYIFANIIATIMLVIYIKNDIKICKREINKLLLKEMIVYSVPLVLNGICWWLSNFTDRVMITNILGPSANGLYAAASKMPHLVSVFAMIFFQAWEISANEEIESRDKTEFYSRIYSGVICFAFISGATLILLCRPLTKIMLGEEYYSSWQIMPWLVISAVAFSLSAFFVSLYTACKKTKMAFFTNLICVIVNVCLNFFLIIRIGTIGAAMATAAAYIVLWIVRVYDTRTIMRLDCKIIKTVISFALLIVGSVVVSRFESWLSYFICLVIVLVMAIINWNQLMDIAIFFVSRIRKK